jgi:SH3-like domain-containing protein
MTVIGERKKYRLFSYVFAAFILVLFFSKFQIGQAQFDSEKELMSVVVKKASVRSEPDDEAEVLWRMWKYMPVEIIAYRGDWRRVRDLDGDEGWMHKSGLGNVPTVMIKKKDAPLRKTRGGKVLWLLDRGYAMRVFSIRGKWVEVSDLSSASGWVRVRDVWGFNTRKSLKKSQ